MPPPTPEKVVKMEIDRYLHGEDPTVLIYNVIGTQFSRPGFPDKYFASSARMRVYGEPLSGFIEVKGVRMEDLNNPRGKGKSKTSAKSRAALEAVATDASGLNRGAPARMYEVVDWVVKVAITRFALERMTAAQSLALTQLARKDAGAWLLVGVINEKRVGYTTNVTLYAYTRELLGAGKFRERVYHYDAAGKGDFPFEGFAEFLWASRWQSATAESDHEFGPS